MSEPQRDQADPGQPSSAVPPPYAGPPPWPGRPAYGPVYGPPTNTYAIISLVLALTVLPPLGIYFGYKAREQIARTGERGAELATVGIVVGWVFTSIWALFFLIWCGFALTMFAGMGSMWM